MKNASRGNMRIAEVRQKNLQRWRTDKINQGSRFQDEDVLGVAVTV